MKIIQVHNYYQQAGGEDGVVEAEALLLRNKGNIVVEYYRSNDDISAIGNKLLAISKLLKASLQTIWNHQTYREFRKLLQTEKPDVVHCHNTFPLISPSIYWACAKEGVPVVQTLHNYRLLCLNAFLFRTTKNMKRHEKQTVNSFYSRSTGSLENASEAVGGEGVNGRDSGVSRGKNSLSLSAKRPSSEAVVKNKSDPSDAICELCVHKSFKWPGIRYRCYRGSLPGSFVVATMLFIHKMIGTWSKKVTAYIALTEFQKKKMVEGGLPEDKIWVKPNFIASDDGVKDEVLDVKSDLKLNYLKLKTGAPYALFVGRLSPEKGCDVLIRAWDLFCEKWDVECGQFEQKELTSDACPLTSDDQKPQLIIVGDGPERAALENLSSVLGLQSSAHFLGRQPKENVLSLMRSAQCLVLPSLWYEGFPMTIVEAFSCGCPVVASGIGSMTSVISDEESGLFFEAGNSVGLAQKIQWAFEHPEQMREMGKAARQVFESDYSAEANYQRLMEIYQQA